MIELCHTEDKQYAQKLVRENMDRYYKEYGIEWQTDLFESSWGQMENFVILSNQIKVGILRLSSDSEALYIRDLQIEKASQNIGLGTLATKLAFALAKERGFKYLRLRVFSSNPARNLYQRLGFTQTGQNEHVISMQANVA
ncbi:MAG: GNAT family N-acetyltransferase [Gammaproteobacteria bacterium]|nr:GNAT family N-acetyltransferase [Gammaproteobacteria bacterium]